jgi:vacuolar-type H+-ATPase subunit I/STV1
MPTSIRSGRIAGLLVILLLVILVPTWALGHWLSGTYPVSSNTTMASASDPSSSDVLSTTDKGLSYGSLDGGSSGQVDDAEIDSDGTDESYAEVNASSQGAPSDAVLAAANDSAAKVSDLQEKLAAVSAHRDRLQMQLENSAQQSEETMKQQDLWRQERNEFVKQIQQQKQRLASLQQQINRQSPVPKPDPDAIVSTATSSEPASTIASLNRKRGWKAINGKIVEAELVGIEGDIVLLKARGKVFRVPLSKLAEEDRAIANQLNR